MNLTTTVVVTVLAVLVWGVLAAHFGLPQWVAGLGGLVIGGIGFFPAVYFVSKRNRGEDESEAD
jgi:hypothetical protein